MPTVVPAYAPPWSFRDNNNNPLVGGKLFTYIAGSSTKQATYTDSTGTVQNTNPIILNTRGECFVWAPPNTAFKFVLASATDSDPPTNPIWSDDNVIAPLTTYTLTAAAIGAALYPQTAAETAAGVTPVAYQWPPGNVLRYGAVGDNSTDCTAALQAAIDTVKSASVGGGVVYLPKGKYKITGSLNLTGLFFINGVTLQGEGRYDTQIISAFNGGPVLDLSGSVFVTMRDFAVLQSGSFKPDEVLLCARTSTNSAGSHFFENLLLQGICNNATAVLWGSEENQFHNVWLASGNSGTAASNVPALTMFGHAPDAGFTPTSPFQTLSSGDGGVGMNSFFGCRITNETGIVQSTALIKLYGTLGSAFYNCFFSCWPGASGSTIDIACTISVTGPNGAYQASVTFDGCSDENAWGNQTTQRTLHFPSPLVGAISQVSGLAVRNCQFFQVYAEDGIAIDGLVYEGGKPSNSNATPTGAKMSFYNLKNAFIAVSNSESGLTYTVRNQGTANYWRGIAAGNVALGTDTTSVISDASGNLLHSGYMMSKSSTGGVGYSTGAGSTVTQITNSGTAVGINTVTGQITTVALTTAAGAEEVFQVNNTACTILDVPVVSTTYTGAGTPAVTTKGVANNGFVIVITNLHATNALNAAMVINFALLRAVAS